MHLGVKVLLIGGIIVFTLSITAVAVVAIVLGVVLGTTGANTSVTNSTATPTPMIVTTIAPTPTPIITTVTPSSSPSSTSPPTSLSPTTTTSVPTPSPTVPTSSVQTFIKGPRRVVWKDFLGVNAHLLFFNSTMYNNMLDKWSALGLEWLRVDLHWDVMEPTQGAFRFTELDAIQSTVAARNMKSLYYLVGSAPWSTSAPPNATYADKYPPKNNTQFAQSLATFALRYPSVNAWQVWNEPNSLGFWLPSADTQGVYSLFANTSQYFTSRNISRQLVLPGMAYYSNTPDGRVMLQDLGSLGIQKFSPVSAYHPYTTYPEGNDPTVRDFSVIVTTQLNPYLRSISVPIWATEWGWSSYAGPVEEQPIIGVQGQADYTLRRLALMSGFDYDRIFLFALSDLDARATDRDQKYGLIDLDGNPKPVYTALKYFLNVTGAFLDPVDGPTTQNGPVDLYGVSWTRPDTNKVWFFWSTTGGTVKLPSVTNATIHDPLTQTSYDLYSASGVTIPTKSSLQIAVWK